MGDTQVQARPKTIWQVGLARLARRGKTVSVYSVSDEVLEPTSTGQALFMGAETGGAWVTGGGGGGSTTQGRHLVTY